MFKRIEDLEDSGLERTVVETTPLGGGRALVGGREMVDFCSNDYLGLAGHPAVIEAACEQTRRQGAGSRAARLLSGAREEAREIERRVAHATGKEAALLFNSGYHANTGMLPVLAGEGDLVFSDQYNHASLIDGIRLSGAEVRVYEHGKPDGKGGLGLGGWRGGEARQGMRAWGLGAELGGVGGKTANRGGAPTRRWS